MLGEGKQSVCTVCSGTCYWFDGLFQLFVAEASTPLQEELVESCYEPSHFLGGVSPKLFTCGSVLSKLTFLHD